jgi:ABC-type sugar transport system ATPase subunit
MMEPYILEMKGITKKFPGVLALNNVSLNVKKGEILALVGENGRSEERV